MEIGVRELPLAQTDKVALVDADYDGEWLATFRWRIMVNGYVASYGTHAYGHKTLYLARAAYGISLIPPKHLIVYKNGDKLDCRTQNLLCLPNTLVMRHRRIQGVRQTRFANKTGYRGVHSWASETSTTYYAAIAGEYIMGSGGSLAKFYRPEDAARAYDEAALKRWGDRAVLNFPSVPAGADEPARIDP